MQSRSSPLLCELHAHTIWSDGAFAIGEVVDLYGRRGFDVLAITDHATRELREIQATNYEAYLASIPHREWSPHFFPFAGLNGIAHSEYHDLYRLSAFLNEKIRDGSFDFLKGTLGARMLRESLRREVWKLEPSPLRLVD